MPQFRYGLANSGRTRAFFRTLERMSFAHFDLTYAVGDVHGREDLLALALTAIDDHAAGRAVRIVMLGDYVDRGPASAQVIARLMRLSGDGRVVCLKGNHEAMMHRAVTEPHGPAMAQWRANGGIETLVSYGVRGGDDAAQVIPADHLEWIEALPLFIADRHRIYVHAGLAPGRDLADQDAATCLWIREAFLRAKPGIFDRHIVHGHTPYWAQKRDPTLPELLEHRTNLDTLAYASGILSVGVFDDAVAGGPVEVLSLRGEADGGQPSGGAAARTA